MYPRMPYWILLLLDVSDQVACTILNACKLQHDSLSVGKDEAKVTPTNNICNILSLFMVHLI